MNKSDLVGVLAAGAAVFLGIVLYTNRNRGYTAATINRADVPLNVDIGPGMLIRNPWSGQITKTSGKPITSTSAVEAELQGLGLPTNGIGIDILDSPLPSPSMSLGWTPNF